MLERFFRAPTQQALQPLAQALARAGLTPNAITILGFVLSLGAAALLAAGELVAGALLILLTGGCDILDGLLARFRGQQTPFGAFLDSTLDRYAEAAIFLGLLAWHLSWQQAAEALLVYGVLVGSLMVSYTRARAEGLGLRCEVGLMARPERVVLLVLGLLLGQVWPPLWTAALGLLALGTNLTAVQRILHARQQLEEPK